MKRAIPVLVVLIALAVLCVVFPPFHVRSLKAVRKAQSNAQFDATEFVGQFWRETLSPATEQAVDVTKVLEAMVTGPEKVREQFGRTVGVSSTYYLFVRGAGRVVAADDDSIGLTIQAEGGTADIVVPLGLVFGNAVRDGTGLLHASSYPNAQEFNDISAVLNSIVETNVLPQLQRVAKLGRRVHFVGCVEVDNEDTDLKPLKLVPIEVSEQKQ